MTNINIKKHVVLIALEDTKSSKEYIMGLARHVKITPKIVYAKHIGTDPKNVLAAIEQHKLQSDNSNDVLCKEWIVIDRDDFPKDNFKGI